MDCPDPKQEESPPEFHPEPEEPQLGHILPLYHMYTSVVSKSMQPEVEYNSTKPPTYDDASLCSSDASNFTRPSLLNSSTYSSTITNNSDVDHIVADEATNNWQNTILQNIHKLKNIDLEDIHIEVKFIKDIGEVGVQPQFIDILNHEYKQGDYINGYVHVKNLGSKPITFDMFYVVFEGYFKVKPSKPDGNKGIVVHKFLEMFDLSASWHYGTIFRIKPDEVTFSRDRTFIDSVDNTKVSFFERIIGAHCCYKRFFTFKIPDRLLDSSCDHGVLSHTEIPPTLGPATPLRYEEATYKNLASIRNGVNDLLFTDSSISYNISARFIGKSDAEKHHPKCTLVDSEGVEYILLKDSSTVVRIVAESLKATPKERKASNEMVLFRFKDFLSRIDQYLDNGANLLATNSNSSEITTSSRLHTAASANPTSFQAEVAKMKQAYKPCSDRKSKYAIDGELKFYHVFLPLQKKLFGPAKHLGTVNIATPKVVHTIKYVPPQMYNIGGLSKATNPEWNIEIPLDIEFACLLDYKTNPNMKPPQVKSISAELTVFTLRTNGECLPFEISYDMMFDDNRSILKAHKVATEYEFDKFETNVIKPVQDRIDKLKEYSQKLGRERFSIDSELVKGLKGIQRAVYRRIRLPIDKLEIFPGETNPFHCDVDQVPWIKKEMPSGESRQPPVFCKQLRVKLDLCSAHYKGMENIGNRAHKIFCLIPTFQLCQMVRMYYVTLAVTLHKGEVITIQVPLEVEK